MNSLPNFDDQLRATWSAVYLTLYTTLVSFVLLHVSEPAGMQARGAVLLVLCGVTLVGVTLLTLHARSRWFRLYRVVWFAVPTAATSVALSVLAYRAIAGS